MKLITLSAASALLAFAAPAQAQFFGPGVDNSTVLGGLTGAGIGGALGSNIAGSGNRDEGTAIGALVGGLAGAAYGNSRSNYYGNPYAGSFNPGFNTRSLLGTAAGAGIGGAIGSNLAGSGVRQEGTAIGALIGGVAGYALSDRSGAFRGSNAPYGYNAPAYGYNTGPQAPVRFAAPQYQVPQYQAPQFQAPQFQAPQYPAPQYFGPSQLVNVQAPILQAPILQAPVYSAPTQTFGGYVNAGTYANTTTSYLRQPATRTVTSYPVVPTTTSYHYSQQNTQGLATGERIVGYSSGCFDSCAPCRSAC